MTRRKQDPDYACAIEVTLDVIGGKWKGTVLHRLVRGPARFNELRRLAPKATQRMMTLQLRELERDGVICRKIYAEVPPKVEYSLTEFGQSLAPMLESMSDWGERYHKLVRARAGKAGSDKSASATVDSQLRIAPSHDVGTQPQD